MSLITGVFLILAAESPSARELNWSELFVCVCVYCVCYGEADVRTAWWDMVFCEVV